MIVFQGNVLVVAGYTFLTSNSLMENPRLAKERFLACWSSLMPLPSADKNFVADDETRERRSDGATTKGARPCSKKRGMKYPSGSVGEDNPFTRGLLVPLFKSVLRGGVQPG